MGRGQQMSSVVVEKPNGNSTLKAADSMRNTAMQRRLVVVALFAAFLPFLITRSYTYYMSSDVSTETEAFIEGQPAADSSLTNMPEVCHRSLRSGVLFFPSISDLSKMKEENLNGPGPVKVHHIMELRFR
jgi:hypothetical protein